MRHGYLLYLREGGLLAQQFDATTLQTTGNLAGRRTAAVLGWLGIPFRKTGASL
jgi:hypothetical protein